LKSLRVLIAGGGTGGHLFPGISIAEELLEHRQCDIRFVGTKRGLEARVIPESPYRLYTIAVAGLYRVGLRKKLITLCKLPYAFLKSFWILLSFRPHLVIGIGGYASGPILALSVILGKRTIIQEQNATPGMTNRILGKYVKLAFIPFAQSSHLFKNPVVTGNPIRKAIGQAALEPPSSISETIVISIVGGSQGAHIINATMAEILSSLDQSRFKIEIIHQTGKSDYQQLCEEYKKYPDLRSEVTEFVNDMVGLYRRTHLFISRAGSMINEIIAMGKASILIPIAMSSGDHQKQNALVLTKANAAVMIEESELDSKTLLEAITRLVTSPQMLGKMGENAARLYQGDAANKIATTILDHFDL
jgi:UDP-N-acetylglucosamine--N-acetylmuramyl-(pentapeptide) pyrophosphoryl-undecaprenol N-acetylglucosamine transferase